MSDSISQPLNKSIKQSVQPQPGGRLSPARASVNQQVLTSSMLTVDDEANKKLIKRYKILTGVGICMLIVGLVLFLALPPLIHSQIISGAIDQAILSQSNENFWAHFPGDSGTIITRNFSFFDLVNDEAVLLHGEIPKFKQIEGYIILEQEDYLDIKYSEDGSKVTMRDWLHFGEHQDSRNLNQTVKIINMPSLGYWFSLKTSRDAPVFLQGFSLLFVNIEQSIIDTVLGQGIASQYLPNFQNVYTSLFEPIGISHSNSLFLWIDPNFGLGNKDNLKYWVLATKTSFNSQNQGFSMDALNLKDYFTLKDEQLYAILQQFRQYVVSLQTIIFKNHYCQGLKQCTGRQLAIRQIASSYVTKDTPPVGSIIPTDTICTDNSTCKGYFPQLAAFYQNVYLKQHPEEDPLLQFSNDMVREWLDYNPTHQQGKYNKAENALLHIGNLDALFNNGTLYDSQQNAQIKAFYLSNIKNRFKLPSDSHTRVFWNWIKYILNGVLRQQSKGNQKLGIGSTFASTLYTSFSILQDQLQPFILKEIIKSDLNKKACNQFISTSLQSENETLITSICNNFMGNVQSDSFIKWAIKVCRNSFQKQWKQLISFGVSEMEASSFCDEEIKGGFGQVYNEARILINDFYSCNKTPNAYCSDFQLALKQWANSTVTMNQPEKFGHNHKKSQTFADWFPSAQAFQYKHYTKKFPQIQFKNFTIDEAYQLFTFDKYFCASHILSLFNDPQTPQYLKDYMRYTIIYIGLGGFTRARTARQFIFGYNDENLLSIKNQYPPFGGDPSIPAYVAFNDLNLTKEEANLQLQWRTGKDNSTMVAQFSKINGFTYLTNNYTKFNGNETYWRLQSPWIGNDFFYGTSGKQFAPDQQSSKNISIYVPNLQRYGSGSITQTYPYQRYGYDLRIAYLGEYIFESTETSDLNKKYYQSFYAIFNETSVIGFPLFVTKHHFLNCTSNWTDLIEMYNENMTIKYENASTWDDSYVIVEPYSGVSFQSTIFLQSNYFYEPDQLFQYNKTTMMPVFSIYRSGNLTQSEANDLFGPLNMALGVKIAMFYIGIVVAIGSVVLIFFACSKLNMLKKKIQRGRNKKLKLSMQQPKGDQSSESGRVALIEKNEDEQEDRDVIRKSSYQLSKEVEQ